MPLNKDIDKILDPILATLGEPLEVVLSGELTDIYLSGEAEMITWGKTKAGIPIAYEGPPIRDAINWAEKRGAALVTEMDVETKRRLGHTISQGIENKRGIPGLARDIKADFGDMTRYRSELIARTETADALSNASLAAMDDMGIEGKEWVTTGSTFSQEDECGENEAQGVIPVGQAFSSGHQGPPAHPNCECAVAPAILPS